jgi:hypothetical protein
MKFNLKDTLSTAATNFVAAVRRPQCWGYLVSLAAIAILALAYFYPDATLGNELRQHDMQQGAAIGQEAKAYVEATGAEQPRWTNSLFSGMPTFQISPSYPSDRLFNWINTLYGAGLPSPSNLLFMMMTGFLILMAAMKVRWYNALIGAVAWGFSTYFIIIIGAGHIWKFVTLAYIPPTIAGVVLAYRGRHLLGCATAALFAMMQIHNNHVQMSYYFMFVILAVVIGFLCQAVRQHTMPQWLKATGALAVAAILAVAANLPNLYNTYKYSKESMRGSHSELVTAADATSGNKTSGLDRDYITQFSYGRSETLTLLIPNVKGGASLTPNAGGLQPTSVATLPAAADAMANANLNEGEKQYVTNYVSQYFGEPEGTNGPVYVGAIICALFLLGCFIVRGPLKWALVVMTALSIGLALGRNMMWLTNLFIDYVPMYAKFRTVESILVIAEFTMPLLAILALEKLLTTPNAFKTYQRQIGLSFGLCALICLIGVLFPSMFGAAITSGDLQISAMIGQQLAAAGYPAEAVSMFSINNPAIASVVETLRYSMVTADSWRSLLLLLAAAAVIFVVGTGRIKAKWFAPTALGVLILFDLYSVNKRYLNTTAFCPHAASTAEQFPLTEADKAILADKDMNFRVLDIPNFYKAGPSYYHKMIGGYHAAKLTRYQDLIDRHLSNFTTGQYTEADFHVLDMLNTRYIVTGPDQVSLNDQALGNAWFVDSITFVDTPNQEMDALDHINPATTAVADKQFANAIGKFAPKQPGDTIFETSYAPDQLTYSAHSAKGGLAVFSEVYFPWGWNCTINGKPAEIARVNYLLRAVNIPAGDSTIELTFKPQSVTNTVAIARVCVIAIYLLLLIAIVAAFAKPEKQPE